MVCWQWRWDEARSAAAQLRAGAAVCFASGGAKLGELGGGWGCTCGLMSVVLSGESALYCEEA